MESAYLDTVSKENILFDEPLSRHTSLRIGGPCKAYITVTSLDELTKLVKALKRDGQSFIILGNGSNVLAPDEGIESVVIRLGGDFDMVRVTGYCQLEAGCGILLSKIAKMAMENGFAGCEFASGIPGTLGGALTMNAGAYGGEMAMITDSVVLMALESMRFSSPVMRFMLSDDGQMTGEFVEEIAYGDIISLEGSRMEFGYRHSIMKEHRFVALYATLSFSEGNVEDIKARINELSVARREKQPLEFPSAGSTFKRPEGYFAAKLIEDAGLKGYRVGDAQVSEKHAGFCINLGNATSADFTKLMKDVLGKVKEVSGVSLEPEVIILDNEDRQDKAVKLLTKSFGKN